MLPGEVARRLELYSEHADGKHIQGVIPGCDQCESGGVTIIKPVVKSNRQSAREIIARLATTHSESTE